MFVDRKIITVLSAPRSGSSALSRMLASLGVCYGATQELVGPTKYNIYGHYESQEILDLNESVLRAYLGEKTDQILQKAGFAAKESDACLRNCFWSVCSAPISAESSVPKELERRMISVIEGLAVSGNTIAWKDARFCMTLPLWRHYMSPVPIIIWRHPLQVAKSIEIMTGVPQEYAIWLWAYYTRAAFEVTKGMNPLVIRHSDLMDRPEMVAERVVAFLETNGLKIDRNISEAVAAINKQEVKQSDQGPPTEKSIEELYQWLEQGASAPAPVSPDPSHCQIFLPLICLARNQLHRIQRLEEQNTILKDTLKSERMKLDRVRRVPGYKLISSLLKLINH